MVNTKDNRKMHCIFDLTGSLIPGGVIVKNGEHWTWQRIFTELDVGHEFCLKDGDRANIQVWVEA